MLEVFGPGSLVGVGETTVDTLAVSSVALKLACMVVKYLRVQVDRENGKRLWLLEKKSQAKQRVGGVQVAALSLALMPYCIHGSPALRDGQSRDLYIPKWTTTGRVKIVG